MNIEEKSKISKEELEVYLAYLRLMGFIAYLDAYKEDDVDSSESDTEERTDREEDYDTESEEEPEVSSEEIYDSETSVEEDTVE
ncbi:hypothetical protein [Macrococcoides bohemicum]|uniref:hypothetical protein n=1 Tax=Macrococcoides bohemicum TaxID=1903056 RepID=UPI00165E4D3E|nr:hypothetical protein [Macrococcus bohemicus]MBC9874946.1 hypothetical protein [Macrococcus bohemicus]